jgi:hypothetical protein
MYSGGLTTKYSTLKDLLNSILFWWISYILFYSVVFNPLYSMPVDLLYLISSGGNTPYSDLGEWTYLE